MFLSNKVKHQIRWLYCISLWQQTQRSNTGRSRSLGVRTRTHWMDSRKGQTQLSGLLWSQKAQFARDLWDLPHYCPWKTVRAMWTDGLHSHSEAEIVWKPQQHSNNPIFVGQGAKGERYHHRQWINYWQSCCCWVPAERSNVGLFYSAEANQFQSVREDTPKQPNNPNWGVFRGVYGLSVETLLLGYRWNGSLLLNRPFDFI